jgi:hypothetical protein
MKNRKPKRFRTSDSEESDLTDDQDINADYPGKEIELIFLMNYIITIHID